MTSRSFDLSQVDNLVGDSDSVITVSGSNVGIGASSPDRSLHIKGSSNGELKIVNTQIANLVDTAPATMDTLNELAAALGDDPNFATTVTNSIATKLPLAGGTMSGTLVVGQTDSGNPAAGTDGIRVSGYGIVGNRGTFYVTNPGTVEIGTGSTHNADPAMTFTSSQNTSLNTLYENSNRVFTDGYHPNADKWTTARTLSLSGDASGSVSWDGSANASISVTVADDSHNHTHLQSDGTTETPDNALQYFQVSQDTSINPSTDWYNTIRMGHGDPVTYYSNTIAVKMTGGNAGDLYTRTIANGTAGNWNRYWHSNNDGSGSGLDADLLDGLQASQFLRIASSGNVGIGTDSPFSTLSTSVGINAPSTSGNMASHGATIHNGSGGRAVQIGVNETGAYNYIQSSYVNNADAGVDLAFFTGAAERMRIDTAGRVTMPYQPSFRATTYTPISSSSGVIVWTTAAHNIGGHYNTSNGTFTAPVAGTYHFAGNILMDAGSSTVYIRVLFRINGAASVTFSDSLTGGTSSGAFTNYSYHAVQIAQSFYLSANDTVQMWNDNSSGSTYNSGASGAYGSFSGFLAG